MGRWEKTWYDAVFFKQFPRWISSILLSWEKNNIQSLFGFRFDHFDSVVGFGLADTDAAVSLG